METKDSGKHLPSLGGILNAINLGVVRVGGDSLNS